MERKNSEQGAARCVKCAKEVLEEEESTKKKKKEEEVRLRVGVRYKRQHERKDTKQNKKGSQTKTTTTNYKHRAHRLR